MVKAIAITSSFFITYFVELVIRIYEFATKSDIDPLIDMIGTHGICMNTLLNSIILLKYDGTVQSSAIELLGLQDWWNQEKARPKNSKKSNFKMLDMMKSTKNGNYNDRATAKSPNSLDTRIIQS